MAKMWFWVLCLCFAPAIQALAHPVEPCVARLSQLAATLKDCELHQVERGQCDSSHMRLESQIAVCRQQQFTDQAINNGIDYGYASLEGDVGQSPYRRQMRKQQWENSLMKPNLTSFSKLFPDAGHIQESLMELFNTQACPKQYAGKATRYVYHGSTVLTRFPATFEESYEEPNKESTREQFRYHFFSAEQPGECYSPDSHTAQEKVNIVNIPDYFLGELEGISRVKVVRCATANCLDEPTELAQLYERYRKQFHRHRQLMVCSDIDQRNETRKTVKGVKRSKVKLPDYCPQDEIQVQALNAEGLLQQLEQRLFQDVTIRIETAKSE